jgi:hypothetical protein
MRNLLISSLLFLAACGQQAPELPPPPLADDAPAATETPTAAPQALAVGPLGATSTTAMGITGALTITPAALHFEKGFAAQTEFMAIVPATNIISDDGESFAAAAPGPVTLRMELRRIVGGAPAQLCGADSTATFVALASDEPLTGLTLIVFSGQDAPGPTAQNSAVCATYSYAVD